LTVNRAILMGRRVLARLLNWQSSMDDPERAASAAHRCFLMAVMHAYREVADSRETRAAADARLAARIDDLFTEMRASHGQVGVDALTRRLAPLVDEIRRRLAFTEPSS
jgi:hypothetical protein